MSTKSFRGRNVTSFSGFRGVDFSSSPLDVDARRASDAENFISDFGILKKRNGWRQEREFVSSEGERLPISGIFPYENGEISHVLVHAGDRFYRLTEHGYERIGAELEGITADRSEAYMQSGRLYIVGCGDYLTYGTWDGESYELRRVYDSEDVYVPVTTINIGSSEGDLSATLDDVNLLTPRRKNRLNGVAIAENESGNYFHGDGTYYFDAPIEMLSEVRLKLLRTDEEVVFAAAQDAPFENALGECAGFRHVSANGDLILAFDREEDLPSESFEIKDNRSTYTCRGGEIRNSLNKVVGTYSADGALLTISRLDLASEITVGSYTVSYPVVQKKGLYSLDYIRSTLSISFSSESYVTYSATKEEIGYGDGEDVFEVLFRAEEASEDGVVPYAERISGCRFGTLFGVDGASDRLFLTGNPALKNVEFYSEADNFLYFPDINTARIGSDNVPIVGYLRLSDGALAVFKEKTGVSEATIYYRSSHYKQYTDASGNLDRVDAIFPTVAGNAGEAMISRHTAKDFGGDKIFLSENGVFGVAVGENITVNERYTRERSRAVNARLTREAGLSGAVATVYKDKYYLAVNGNVYVADARYRNTRSDNMDGAWGYEWYFLTGVPARVFAEIGGELWFGTEDGRLCRFDDEYTDRTYALYREGELSVSGGLLTVSGAHDVPFAAGGSFFTHDRLFAVVLDRFSSVKSGKIYPEDLERLGHLAEGERVYLDENGEAFEIRDVDLFEGCFSLYKDGNIFEPELSGLRILRLLSGLELEVAAVSGSTVQLSLWGETLALVGEVKAGKLTFKRAVCARWVSAVTDLGVSMVGKSLHRLSITCEPTVRGRVTFGYNTRVGCLRKASEGGGRVFSLADLDFRAFSFETGFAASYSVRVFERGVNYMALAVESAENTACAFNRLELEWTYGRHLAGVR